MFHAADCKHSYAKYESHSFAILCKPSYMRETIGQRIRRYREERQLTQQEVGDAVGRSRVAVSKWESGNTKDLKRDSLVGIAKLFGVSLEELLGATSLHSTLTARALLTGKLTDANAAPGPDIVGKVPLISWVRAGEFCGVVDNFAPGDAEEWLPMVHKLGPHAYALRVQGDSMTASYGRSYPDGAILFVDPEAHITNGCRVIAKIPGANEATFKVYAEDAGQRFLKPLNPQYPTITMTSDMIICGVVKGMFLPE